MNNYFKNMPDNKVFFKWIKYWNTNVINHPGFVVMWENYKVFIISCHTLQCIILWNELFKFQNRKFVASLIDFPLPLYIFSVFIYFTRSWQNLHYITATACAFGLPLLYFVIPESPRWLIMHDRKEDALKIFLQVNFILMMLCS